MDLFIYVKCLSAYWLMVVEKESIVAQNVLLRYFKKKILFN